MGHVREECRGPFCSRCSERGHFTKECPKKKVCDLCLSELHVVKECPLTNGRRVYTYAAAVRGNRADLSDLPPIHAVRIGQLGGQEQRPAQVETPDAVPVTPVMVGSSDGVVQGSPTVSVSSGMAPADQAAGAVWGETVEAVSEETLTQLSPAGSLLVEGAEPKVDVAADIAVSPSSGEGEEESRSEASLVDLDPVSHLQTELEDEKEEGGVGDWEEVDGEGGMETLVSGDPPPTAGQARYRDSGGEEEEGEESPSAAKKLRAEISYSPCSSLGGMIIDDVEEGPSCSPSSSPGVSRLVK